ncbi:hypothetical protein HMPREF0281_00551 [Corynebacterium ammoniagenes DSM 20306]|uniref:Uncharacterized protein n=1 Tax=Corynebacterium ammoniagenes DSM 20306 TaxID=649754 RepID=A0ABP2II90_CORAM|nr:hypothetical protein HMPREF0281_00551 [Corynebacterium ammoniagenes DSM 20306]
MSMSWQEDKQTMQSVGYDLIHRELNSLCGKFGHLTCYIHAN